MFENGYESRLREWHDFRSTLENCKDPFTDCIVLYKNAPRVFKTNVDPWDKKTWLDPWQLVEKNLYSEMCITLGICYSLQLTERFSNSSFEIHNTVDTKSKDIKSKVINVYNCLSKKVIFTNNIRAAETAKVIENIQRFPLKI